MASPDYAKGYAAGKRRKAREISAEQRERERTEFRRRVFLAVLPTCIEVSGWQRDGKPIKNLDQRTALAWNFADEAMKQHH